MNKALSYTFGRPGQTSKMIRTFPKREWHRFLAILGLLVSAFLVFGCGTSPRPDFPPIEARSQPRQQSRTAGSSYDLARDEERGGHTLERHVGRTDAELRERLEREGNISAASTWTNRETAETVVAEALAAEHGRVESWMRRGYRRPNLALHYDASRVIGRSLRRGDSVAVDCTSAAVVLRADGPSSFYVLTTYPEARE